MDDSQDPIHNFFPSDLATQEHILYSTLSVEPSATAEEIRKAYRKLALKYHPDKQSAKSDKEKEEAGKEFQRVGFAYAVLSDEGKRKRYDATGRTDESGFAGAEEMGWEAYFETLFERIDRKVLDEDKKKYQGSDEEKQDIIEAYTASSGSFPDILSAIPHSTVSDETRFITLVNSLITSGELESTKAWKRSSTDTGAASKRSKSAAKEAKEAEEAAKDLGVWDEFYGSGAKGKRKADETDGKGKKAGSKGKKGGDAGDGGGEDALALLIQKRQRSREEGFSAMEEKYRKIEEERAGKKAKKGKGKGERVDQENEGPPELSDADFEAFQAKLFADKPKSSGGGGKGKKSRG